MKIYCLKNQTGTIFFSAMVESADFWLVPVKDCNAFDAYPKDVFTLSIIEAKEPEASGIGFTEAR